MVLSMIRSHFFEIEHKYLLQILLKVYHQCKDFVILKCTPKMPSFFDKNFVKIGIIKFELVKQVSGEQIGKLSLRIFFYFFQLVLQTILALGYNLLQVFYFSVDVFFKHSCDILFKLLYFLGQKSSDLTQFIVDLKNSHVVFLVVLNLGLFPGASCMQTTQSFPYQILCLIHCLIPVNIAFMGVLIFAESAQLFIVITEMRPTDTDYRSVVHLASSFVLRLRLLHFSTI